MFRFQLRQIPFYFLLFVVTYLSVMPAITAPGFELSDKVLHFLAYGGVAGGAFLAFPGASWRLALFVVLWGVGIELVQWQMPTRMFELLDIVANTLGCVAGWQAMNMIYRVCPRLAG